jgi:response regulator RpfG family c-di-GMP phosphodiesterase
VEPIFKSPPSQKRTVLAVDDVSEILLTIKLILKDYYELCLAKSTDAAKQVLSRTKVDLILLDIEMPETDGFEFLAWIREHEEWKDIPVIFVTATATVEFITRAVNAGARDYVAKPLRTEILLKKVDDIFIAPFLLLLAELEEMCATGRDDRAKAALKRAREDYQYLGSTFETSSLLDEITMLIEQFRDFPVAAAKTQALIDEFKADRGSAV